jgi:hypothetical protein
MGLNVKVKAWLEFPRILVELLSGFLGALWSVVRGRVSDTAKCGWFHKPGLKTEMVRIDGYGEPRDLPPISHPVITGVSRFWFCCEIISQPS